VASAAALLVGAGHQNGNVLSTDPIIKSTTNRNGDIIYNSERSEVIKAALMAGANRTSPNLNAYAVNTTNGLNNVLGSGELNIYNSYHIITAGEKNSQEDSSTGQISTYGFDYDPQFGGSNSSNRTATYLFKAVSSDSLSASLVWNLKVAGGTTTFNTSATLYNLSLHLYDTTTSQEVVSSNSSVDNTQNIWQAALTPDHDYMLQVKAETAGNFLWDYGLAWDINAATAQADTVPPVRSSGSPTGSLSSGTTQTTLSLTTNENAICKYATSANTAYASMANTLSTTGATSHSTIVTGLTNGNTYTYYVRCQDSSSNANTDDYIITFSIQSDTTPPTISSVQAIGLTASSATVTWITNENSTSQVEYGPTASYGTQTAIDNNLTSSHSVNIASLTPNTTYHFRVRSQDSSNNEAVSADYTFITIASFRPEDIDQDGQVNTQDIQACINQILGLQSWPRADVNQDGKFDVKDLQRIVNVILGV
jgi:hypothetical protein